MNRKFILLLLLLPAALTGLFSLAQSEDIPSSDMLLITDSYDREVGFTETPRRIVSTAPNITEIVFALGCGDLLVGRTDFCDFPEEAAAVESIGTLQEPNLEQIIALEPDVVITSTHFPPEQIQFLEDVGIKVVGFYSDNFFEGTFTSIEQIGLLLDKEENARQMVASMKRDIQDIRERVSQAESIPSVYYVVGFGPYGDFTAGGDTFIHELLEMAGGKNIAEDVEGWGYSFEKIVEEDPDIIICSAYWEAKEGLETTEGYRDLRAVKEGRLYAFDNNMVDRQGPRLAEGLRALAEILHRELF